MVEVAGPHLSIMAGAGVRPDNAAALVAATGVREIHGSASRPGPPPEEKTICFGFAQGPRRITDRRIVAGIAAAIGQAETRA